MISAAEHRWPVQCLEGFQGAGRNWRYGRCDPAVPDGGGTTMDSYAAPLAMTAQVALAYPATKPGTTGTTVIGETP
jgi:hypothetical protein